MLFLHAPWESEHNNIKISKLIYDCCCITTCYTTAPFIYFDFNTKVFTVNITHKKYIVTDKKYKYPIVKKIHK